MNFKIIYILVLTIVFTSCNNIKTIVSIDSLNSELELVNGILKLSNNPFTGRLTANYVNKNLKSEVFYTDGKKNGSEKYWFENGDLAQERFYINGFKSGIHKGWWKSANPKFVYHFNDRGAYNGEVKEWYRSGQPYMSFNYENGKEKGSQRLWKMNGTIKANYEVVNGERFGLIGLKKCSNVSNSMNSEIVIQNLK